MNCSTSFSIRGQTAALQSCPRVVSLLTDFGIVDPYVGQLKSSLIYFSTLIPPEQSAHRQSSEHCDCISLVDLTHSIPQGNILRGAEVLRGSVHYFPPHAIHLAVVDPGVGSARKRIIIKARVKDRWDVENEAIFVGPDNGIFSLAAADSQIMEVWDISEEIIKDIPRTGKTFDGRDIFAPIVGLILAGLELSELAVMRTPDSEGFGLVKIQPRALKEEIGEMVGEVVDIDFFGNAITSIPFSKLPEQFRLYYEEQLFINATCVSYYAQIPQSMIGYLESSQGMLEMALNCESLAARYGIKIGGKITIRW